MRKEVYNMTHGGKNSHPFRVYDPAPYRDYKAGLLDDDEECSSNIHIGYKLKTQKEKKELFELVGQLESFMSYLESFIMHTRAVSRKENDIKEMRLLVKALKKCYSIAPNEESTLSDWDIEPLSLPSQSRHFYPYTHLDNFPLKKRTHKKQSHKGETKP